IPCDRKRANSFSLAATERKPPLSSAKSFGRPNLNSNTSRAVRASFLLVLSAPGSRSESRGEHESVCLQLCSLAAYYLDYRSKPPSESKPIACQQETLASPD